MAEINLRIAFPEASDAEIARRFIASVGGKKAGHGIDGPDFRQPDRPMSAIGG